MGRPANTPYESTEYDRLVKRKFKPYSLGHQRMYTKAIERIHAELPRTEVAEARARIFEAGFGIGFGLQKMVEAGIVESYTGCEPNRASYDYTAGIVAGLKPLERIHIYNESFGQVLADRMAEHGFEQYPFDEAFCIEVIEHVPMDQHLEFLIALRQMAPRLWFSSPDKTKSREGVRTIKEWTTLLKQARFEKVDVDVSEWTYLYECR